MSLTIIFSILSIHFLADFVFQTNWQASNKSKSNLALTLHITTYSLTWFLASIVYGLYNTNLEIILYFAPITFICHWITDYITSRIVKYFFENKDNHNGFVIIGIDQLLHYGQLFLTFKYLTD